jgi:hypothetical protein
MDARHELVHLLKEGHQSRHRHLPTPFSSSASTVFLVACIFILLGGCGSDRLSDGLRAPPSPVSAQCVDGLAAMDLAGQCRSAPQTTMGALESSESATNNSYATIMHDNANPMVRLSWKPDQGQVSGYMIYYGAAPDETNILASDLSIASGVLNPESPTVTYDATRDLGMLSGNSVCFRIYAYVESRSLSNSPQLTCTHSVASAEL